MSLPEAYEDQQAALESRGEHSHTNGNGTTNGDHEGYK